VANISILNNGNYLEQFASSFSATDPYSGWSINSRIAETLQGFSDYNVSIGVDYRAGGYLNYGLLSDGRFRVTTDFFDLFYTGNFSTQGSLVSRIDVQGTDGSLTTVTGNIGYAGTPFFSGWTDNSSISSLSYGTLINGSLITVILDLMSTITNGTLSGKVIGTRSLLTSDLLPSGTAYYEVASGSGLPFTVTDVGRAQGQASVTSGSISNVYLGVGDVNTLAPIDQVSISGLQIQTSSPSSEAFSNSGSDNYTVDGKFGVSLEVGAGNDTVQGGPANDSITGEAGNDALDGRGSTDVAIFSGSYNQYSFSKIGSAYVVSDSVSNRDGVDTLSNIEFVKFSDKTVNVSDLISQSSSGEVSVSGTATNSAGKNESVVGSSQIDKFIYTTAASTYQVNYSSGRVTVKNTASGEEDSLTNIERLKFADKSMAFDIADNAGKAYRVYKAAFSRDPQSGDMSGLGFWISRIDNGMDMVEVAARFIDSNEFRSLYGQSPTNAEFLTKVYTNVLGRTPDQGGYDWWLNELNTNSSKTKAKVLADFAESGENQSGVATLIGNGISYTEFVT
jgi:hypothetical protein